MISACASALQALKYQDCIAHALLRLDIVHVQQHGAAQMSPSHLFSLYASTAARSLDEKDALAVKVSRFKTVNEVNDVSPATRNGYLWRNTAHYCLPQAT